MKNFFKLLISISIPLLVGLKGFLFILESSDWHLVINKPFFSLPSWMFVSVWIVSYILIGLSFYFIWKKKELKELKDEIFICLAQLGLILLWFTIFFGYRNPDIAFIEMFFLLISTAIFSLKFYKINNGSGYLLIPYIVWVSFVAVLNYAVAILN